MKTIRFVPQETLPRSTMGIDWGRTRKVLVRSGNKTFFTVPGHTGWVGRGSQGYYQSSHHLSGSLRPLHQGRLTGKILYQLNDQLEEFFDCKGQDIWNAIWNARGRTLVLDTE